MDWLHSRKLTGVLIIDAFHLEEVTLLRVPVHCHCHRTLKLTCIFPAVPSQSVNHSITAVNDARQRRTHG